MLKLKYRFMSLNKMSKRLEKINKRLAMDIDAEERKKLLTEMFIILDRVIIKGQLHTNYVKQNAKDLKIFKKLWQRESKQGLFSLADILLATNTCALMKNTYYFGGIIMSIYVIIMLAAAYCAVEVNEYYAK